MGGAEGVAQWSGTIVACWKSWVQSSAGSRDRDREEGNKEKNDVESPHTSKRNGVVSCLIYSYVKKNLESFTTPRLFSYSAFFQHLKFSGRGQEWMKKKWEVMTPRQFKCMEIGIRD